MNFFKNFFLHNKNDEKIALTQTKIEGCVKCGDFNFEYSKYFNEYTCNNCGWTAMERPKGKVNVIKETTQEVVLCKECGLHAALSPDGSGVGAMLCKNCMEAKNLMRDSCCEKDKLLGESKEDIMNQSKKTIKPNETQRAELTSKDKILFNLLVQFVNDSNDEQLRLRINEILSQTGESLALSVVLMIANSHKGESIIASMNKLENELIAPLIREFIDHFDDYDDATILRRVLPFLNQFDVEFCSPIIQRALNSKNAVVRAHLAKKIDLIGDKSLSLSFFKKMINDEGFQVADSAIKALGDEIDESLAPLLKEKLEKDLCTEGWPYGGSPVAIALGKLQDNTSIPLIKKLLKKNQKNKFIQRDAIFALGLIGGSDVFEPLDEIIKVQTGSTKFRQCATVFEAVAALLKTEHPDNRALAARILGNLGDPSVIPELEEFLHHTEQLGYGKYYGKEIIEAIEKLKAKDIDRLKGA